MEKSSTIRPFPRRGSFLLLDHCLRLEQLATADGRGARGRLEQRLGVDLTRRLVGSLSGDHALRPRDLAA